MEPYQIGAEEARWAHNPKVGGSKPLSDKIDILYLVIKKITLRIQVNTQNEFIEHRRLQTFGH